MRVQPYRSQFVFRSGLNVAMFKPTSKQKLKGNHYTAVPAMYSPPLEQTPGMCGPCFLLREIFQRPPPFCTYMLGYAKYTRAPAMHDGWEVVQYIDARFCTTQVCFKYKSRNIFCSHSNTPPPPSNLPSGTFLHGWSF